MRSVLLNLVVILATLCAVVDSYFVYYALTNPSMNNMALTGSGQNLIGGVQYTSTGAIVYSEDYAKTWTVSNSPVTSWSKFAMSKTTGKYAMAMSYDGSGGKAYFSSDFGKTWAANNAVYTGAQA